MLFSGFLIFCGAVFGARFRFFCFLHPIRTAKRLFSKQAGTLPGRIGYSPFRALALALAGTLGVGNITGVAAALSLGGPGALFWMWVSALATMLIKYAEITAAMQTRIAVTENGHTVYHGGPMFVLPLLPHGASFAELFCFLCIAASFVQGNFLQTQAAARCLKTVFSVPETGTALVIAAAAAVVVFGGRQRISLWSARLLPLMTACYFCACLSVLIRCAPRLPGVLAEIIKDAFSLRAAGGGGVGTMLSAMHHGCAKGVFSHEAGCGTAPISHAGAETDDFHRQGILGIAEVAVDTLLLCTVTGLVLLVSFPELPAQDPNVQMLSALTLWFGRPAGAVLAVFVCFYAFSSLVCWSFYGTECVRAVFRNRRAGTGYLLLFCLCTPLAAVLSPDGLWAVSDGFCILMTVLNTTGCLLLADRLCVPVMKAGCLSEKTRKSGRKKEKPLDKRKNP